MYATAANLYGSQVEPLYETAKQQLEEIKKQDKYYRELCNNGPDKEADKYQKKDVDDIKFDKEKYQRDLDRQYDLLAAQFGARRIAPWRLTYEDGWEDKAMQDLIDDHNSLVFSHVSCCSLVTIGQ